MVDIRTIRGKDKTDAFAKARVEYGSNFYILSSKDIQVGGFLGLGKKTEHEIRIMLNNSIYDKKNADKEINNNNVEEEESYNNKLNSDRIEMNKHKTEVLDASEMAERLINLNNALKKSARERSENLMAKKSAAAVNITEVENAELVNNNKSFKPMQFEERYEERKVNNNLNDFNGNYNFGMMGGALLSDSDTSYVRNTAHKEDDYSVYNSQYQQKNNVDSIEANVKRILQDQLKDIVKEYLENNIPNIDRNNFNSKNYNRREKSNNSFYQNNDYDSIFQNEERSLKNTIEEIKNYRREDNHLNSSINKTNFNNFYQDDFEEDNDDNSYPNKNIITKDSSVTDSMEDSFNFLRHREFPEEVLIELREYLLTSSNARFFQSKDVIKEEIERYFSSRLLLANGIDIGSKKKIVVFVGPTGVGKTTTIPKIAAQYMRSGKKVSFVTIDNYRIAAVDQLQRYASIMKVPFTSASTPEALRAEIRKLDSSSLLFIDTMGRSPKSVEEIVSMSKYFNTVGRFDMDVQLVMSSTAKYKDALKIMNAFKPANYKGIILTKVDETDYLASSLCAISKSKVPITYVTYGQGVPKDIAPAKRYAHKMIEGLFGNDR
ncbi:flagellar biosynthesis regulator FlhF [Brachyspira pilosicoli]|uniref:flagellar biosynthesis protein FlhF n=1 Tax=Brachyspira pilosicoli TaxID=52584 RepID=UPI001CA54654|nr:flagellar biosynthesis regulator FlhF [Brachyspira pilosicoli]MBW5397447.1 flagellar biosynthesis regulator FlhF [Brachyspira pilosicoli]